MINNTQIRVTSNVGRDLLQSAALFKTDKLVAWEYVSNALQYVDTGVSPRVKVTLDGAKKRMTIQDNGRGMSWDDLSNYFVMHGENLDRKAGRAGRGRFGTGKSAAFGIANTLRVTTVRNGKRSKVELRRADIESQTSGDGVPVRTLEREVPTNAPNGTLVEIEQIGSRSLDQAGIIRNTERHLARWPRGIVVQINQHECEFHEPATSRTVTFKAEGDFLSALGDVELTVKVAKAPLEEELRGVSIYCNGVWYETTLAGGAGKEMAHYIFGDLDVPQLEKDTSLPAPFDMSRSMQLNAANPLVAQIYAFISQKVESVRRELAEAERKRKVGEEAKKLSKQAAEIAQILNDDFSANQERIAKAKARAGLGADAGPQVKPSGEGDDTLISGDEVRATVVAPADTPEQPSGPSTPQGGDAALERPAVEAGGADDPKQGQNAGSAGNKTRSSGGFSVKFEAMGAEEYRAKYQRDERAIYINLDHPQFVAALTLGSLEDTTFRRLSYEVAFTEYSMALAFEKAAVGDYLDADEPIDDIRRTLHRVSLKGAALYAA